MLIAIGTRLGTYEILARIGVGGMGEVYRARDSKLDRDVAIKTLRQPCCFLTGSTRGSVRISNTTWRQTASGSSWFVRSARVAQAG